MEKHMKFDFSDLEVQTITLPGNSFRGDIEVVFLETDFDHHQHLRKDGQGVDLLLTHLRNPKLCLVVRGGHDIGEVDDEGMFKSTSYRDPEQQVIWWVYRPAKNTIAEHIMAANVEVYFHLERGRKPALG